MLFGILSIAVGGSCLLLGLLQLALPLLARRTPGMEALGVDVRSQAMGVMLYALLGAAFIAVGAGSVRKRRWVRSMMLILAWTWLLGGILVLPLLPGVVEGVLRGGIAGGASAAAPGVGTLATFIVLVFAGFVGVVLPALFVWTYQDRNLLLTCEAYHPSPTWTERCPVAVLGLSLGLAALAALGPALALRPVVPWFGRLITGWPGSLLTLAGAAACAYLAWSTFKLRGDGWWGSTILLVAIGASTLWTLARVELADFYRALGYREQQLDLLERSGILNGRVTFWLTALVTVLSVGYMVSIRKHFRQD